MKKHEPTIVFSRLKTMNGVINAEMTKTKEYQITFTFRGVTVGYTVGHARKNAPIKQYYNDMARAIRAKLMQRGENDLAFEFFNAFKA